MGRTWFICFDNRLAAGAAGFKPLDRERDPPPHIWKLNSSGEEGLAQEHYDTALMLWELSTAVAQRAGS